MTLTKHQAIAIFGNQSEIARAVGLSRSAISLWPEQLTQRQSDLILGAALRLGKPVPEGFIAPIEQLIEVSDGQSAAV